MLLRSWAYITAAAAHSGTRSAASVLDGKAVVQGDSGSLMAHDVCGEVACLLPPRCGHAMGQALLLQISGHIAGGTQACGAEGGHVNGQVSYF